MTPEEARTVVAQLAQGLGIPADVPGRPDGPARVLRLTLKGRPNPDVGRGLGKIWWLNTGEGLLGGALIAAATPGVLTSWEGVAVHTNHSNFQATNQHSLKEAEEHAP